MVHCSLIIGVASVILCQIAFYIVSRTFENEEMLRIFPAVMVMMASFMLKDITVGLLIGLGLQKQTIWVNIISNLGFGIPLSIYLTFRVGLIHYGPWIGISISVLIFNAGYFFYIYLTCDVKEIIDKYKSNN